MGQEMGRSPTGGGRGTTRTKLGESQASLVEPWRSELLRITVVGVGDAGSSCVARVAAQKIPGVRHLLVNSQADSSVSAGCGVQTIKVGERQPAARVGPVDFQARALLLEEATPELVCGLEGSQLVFVTAGMGGATGTMAAPHVACLARDQGAFVVGVVTTPFSFEGSRRIGEAVAGVARLRECCHSLVVIHGDRLLRDIDKGAEIIRGFQRADAVVSQGIAGISGLLNDPRGPGISFAEFREVLGQPGCVLMAVGTGHGSSGALEAARHAIAHPLLNLSVQGAAGTILLVKSSPGLLPATVQCVAQMIARIVHKKARVLSGMSVDEGLRDAVEVTLLATGL